MSKPSTVSSPEVESLYALAKSQADLIIQLQAQLSALQSEFERIQRSSQDLNSKSDADANIQSAPASVKSETSCEPRDSSDEFNPVKPKKSKRQKRKQARSLSSNVEQKMECEETTPPSSVTITLAESSKSAVASDINREKSPVRTEVKSGRIPPICLKNKADWMKVHESLTVLNIVPKRVLSRNDCMRIYLTSRENYRDLIKSLVSHKIEFFSYPYAEDKTQKFVIRGVNEFIPIDAILADLKRQNLDFISASRMKKQGKPMPLILIELPKSPAVDNIHSITQVCGIDVTVETKRPSPIVGQCHRCQKFGHSSRNCHSAWVCVKCAGNHSTPECFNSMDKNFKSKCINCGGDHQANYRGCPKTQRATKSAKPKVQTQPRSQSVSKPANSISTPSAGISYAQAVKPKSQRQSPKALYPKLIELLAEITQLLD